MTNFCYSFIFIYFCISLIYLLIYLFIYLFIFSFDVLAKSVNKIKHLNPPVWKTRNFFNLFLFSKYIFFLLVFFISLPMVLQIVGFPYFTILLFSLNFSTFIMGKSLIWGSTGYATDTFGRLKYFFHRIHVFTTTFSM